MIGIERRKMGTERHQFTAGAGLGHVAVKYTDHTDEISAAAARVGVDYKGKITDKISFSENIVVLYSKERTMKRAISSINYAITDKASISLSYEVSHRNKIADTAIDKKDDITDLNFILKF
jgi:putative salt-induced outer membrane protein YdiY